MKSIIFNALGLIVSCALLVFSIYKIQIFVMFWSALMVFLFFVGTFEAVCENTRLGLWVEDFIDRMWGR